MSSLSLKYIKQAKMAGKYFVWWAKMKEERCGHVYWWAASAPPHPRHWPQRNKQDKHYFKVNAWLRGSPKWHLWGEQ